MKDLIFQLVCLTKHNHDGSFATQSNRKAILKMCGEQLLEHPAYRRLTVTGLDPVEHPWYLVARWKAEGISHATIRNRLSVLRWWAEKVNKADQVPDNALFGLEPRTRVATASKAQNLPQDLLAQIPDPYIRMSLELQRAFGLRREEALKIRPHQADHGDTLVLQGSWCKNGRPRKVPIGTAAQRAVLERAKALAGSKTASLIPAWLRYIDQVRRYEYWCPKVGLHKMHGLRHAYAGERYEAMTGQQPPAKGGPRTRAMTPAQATIAREARMTVSRELGHNRPQVTATYLG